MGSPQMSDRQASPSLTATCGENLAAVGSRHPLTETMRAAPLDSRGLIGAFHVISLYNAGI